MQNYHKECKTTKRHKWPQGDAVLLQGMQDQAKDLKPTQHEEKIFF